VRPDFVQLDNASRVLNAVVPAIFYAGHETKCQVKALATAEPKLWPPIGELPA
jgi:hypothetical protein